VLLTALHGPVTETSLYLWGSQGSGCSHLLRASCDAAQKKNQHALYLDLRHTDSLLPLLGGALEGIQLLALDHFDVWLGDKNKEEQLFNIFNRASQVPFVILWSCALPPQALDCLLSDFQSRLSSLLVFQVHPLNDLDLYLALQQHAKQRGFTLSHEVAQYMLNHYPRDLPSLLQLLEQLDQASLRSKKPLTIALLKGVIIHT